MSAITELTPLEMTRELLDVSVTELGGFRTCRRRWHLETIENLEPKAPTFALAFGTGLHAALEQIHSGRKTNRLRDGLKALRGWYDAADARAIEDELPAEVRDELHELHELGITMLTNYMEYDKTAKIQLGAPVAVEGRFVKGAGLKSKRPAGYPKEAEVIRHPSGRMLVPIVHPETKELAQQGEVPAYLTARIDLLTDRKSPYKGLCVVDHKSTASAPNDRALDFNDQATGYTYVVWRWLSKLPRSVIFNYLIKQAPKEPRMVRRKGSRDPKDVVLSTAKDQLTTPDQYKEALKREGLIMPSGKVIDGDYADCYASLLAHGWDRFFTRFQPTRNEAEIMAFEERLYEQWLDMGDAVVDERKRYPNLGSFACPGCSVNTICQALNEGTDAEYIADTHFRVGPDRKAEQG